MVRKFIFLAETIPLLGIMALLGAGCSSENDDLQKEIIKVLFSDGCRGCDSCNPEEGEVEGELEGESVEGEGEIPAEGEGETPVEGESIEGEMPNEGEGETLIEGEGEGVDEGEVEGRIVLSIGESTGLQGAVVPVPVALATNGSQPSTVLFQIEFDSNWLTFQGVTAGIAATAAEKSVDANYVWPNHVHVIVYGGRTILNDGEMLTISFQVSKYTPDTVFHLTGAQPSAADPSALRIPCVTTDGSITVATDLQARQVLDGPRPGGM